jgi:hypothetical protein
MDRGFPFGLIKARLRGRKMSAAEPWNGKGIEGMI